MHPAIERFDAAADAALDRIRTPQLDHVAYALGSACDHSILWHAIASVRAAHSGDVRRFTRVSGALALESALTNGVVKSLFGRVRPKREHVPGQKLPHGMRVPITSSFPSGHAAAAFCAAVILTDETDNHAWYALATLVGVTRVYVRMHHASDVIGGAAWGYLLGRALKVVLPR